MIIISLLLALALTGVDFDVASVPVSGDVRLALNPAGRLEMKREGTVSRIRVDIDRVAAPASQGAAFNTYVVWVVSPEGIVENLGELEISGNRGQFSGTTRLTQFGVLVSAEPHYMVDRPSSAVPYRSVAFKDDLRRKSAHLDAGAYDYSALKPTAANGVHASVVQARAAFQIAQAVGADSYAPEDFRNAQAAFGSLEELVSRNAPLDIFWPVANEAIRWSQRAAATARAKR